MYSSPNGSLAPFERNAPIRARRVKKRTNSRTFLFSLLENKEDYEKIEHYVGSSYIADEITVDGLKQFLKSFPIKSSFS